MRKRSKVLVQTIERARYTRRLTLEEKTCPQCGKQFEGVKKRTYCSRACQAKADYERHADQYRKARVEKYHAERKAAAKQ
jgi:endogenous inhibitor of DNA gyrase (YacG/DUF329 family)